MKSDAHCSADEQPCRVAVQTAVSRLSNAFCARYTILACGGLICLLPVISHASLFEQHFQSPLPVCTEEHTSLRCQCVQRSTPVLANETNLYNKKTWVQTVKGGTNGGVHINPRACGGGGAKEMVVGDDQAADGATPVLAGCVGWIQGFGAVYVWSQLQCGLV